MSENHLIVTNQFQRYVTFEIGTELFGIRIEVVQQIISVPPITSVPRTPNFFLGMLNLRGETISAIDLRLRFGLPPTKENSEKRVIIVDFKQSRLGLLVDKMGSVLNIDSENIQPPPPLIDPKTLEYLIAAVQLDEQQTLLLLDQEKLINTEEFQIETITVRSDPTNQTSGDSFGHIEPEQVLVGFILHGENYVLDISNIEEIIRIPSITSVPQISHIVEGVFHLRNQVIPLLSLSKRLGLPESEIKPESPAFIVNILGVKIGLLIDEISEVLRIRKSRIETLPQNVNGERASHLGGLIQGKMNDKKIIHLVLLIDSLFEEAEIERLIAFQQNTDEYFQSEHQTNEEEILSLLCFTIASEVYAIRLLQINQITGQLPILDIPKAPPYIKGVINVRGEIITVLDLPKMFRSQETIVDEKAKIVVIDVGSHIVGLQVEEVVGIRYLSNKIFEFPDDWGEDKKLVEAIGKEKDDQVTVLLNMQTVLDYAVKSKTK